MKTVLVTGGGGFIGSRLIGRLLNEGDTVICLDTFVNSAPVADRYANVMRYWNDKKFYLVEGSVLNPAIKEIFVNHAIDVVIHLAGIGGIRPPQQMHRSQMDISVLGTVNLLDLCVKYEVEHFVFMSSSAVYGDSDRVPFNEDQPSEHPLCAYATSKKAGEMACYEYHDNINISIVRPFTVYGAGQKWEMAIPVFTDSIYRGKPISIFGDGSAGRDYIDVRDVTRAISLILWARRGHSGYEIYNVGVGRAISINSLVAEIAARLPASPDPIIRYVPEAKGEAKLTIADVAKAKSLLGFEAEISISQGLNDYVHWFLAERRR